MEPHSKRMAIWELCLLVAGLAVGFWLFGMGQARGPQAMGDPPWRNGATLYGTLIGVLGGLSLVGPPILIWERRRRQRRFGPGEILWFSHGMSAWLLWPPIVIVKVRAPQGGGPPDNTMGEWCFAYGTPLMALYVGSALLAGGWIRRRGRRRRHRSWTETFGLILGIIWACTGGYCLYAINFGIK